MAAKKKQSKIDPTGLSPKSRTQPTASFTSPGKKATQSRSRSAAEKPKETKVTKVKNAESGFAGSGTPLGTSFGISRPTAAKNVANALFTVAMTPVGRGVRAAVVSKIVKKSTAPADAGAAAFNAAAKGLSKATGAGGRVSRTYTPMGKTLRSTVIGSPAQQKARIDNLYANAQRIGNRTEAATKTRMIAKTTRVVNKAAKVISEGSASALAATNKPKNKKK